MLVLGRLLGAAAPWLLSDLFIHQAVKIVIEALNLGIEYYLAAHLKVMDNRDHTCTRYFTYNYIPRSFRVISRSRSLSEFVLKVLRVNAVC